MGGATGSGPVVVTGGAGAIGSGLARRLHGLGRSVRVIDNLSTGRREPLHDLERAPGFEFHAGDVRELARIQPIFRQAEEVWHLAANPDIRKGTAEPRLDLDQGTVATFTVLEATRLADVPRFFFSSSSVVYGLPSRFPTPESYGPLMPESQYGAAKLAAEALVSAYAHSYGLRGWIFRFANIVGPGMTHGVVYDFLEKLRRDPTRLEVLGDGRQAKSYLWLDDCLDALLLAGERATETVNIFNLGNRDQIPVREIAERVVRAVGVRAGITYTGGDRGWVGDIPNQLLDIERIRSLGWRPKLSSAEAIDRTIAVLRLDVGI